MARHIATLAEILIVLEAVAATVSPGKRAHLRDRVVVTPHILCKSNCSETNSRLQFGIACYLTNET